MQEGDRVKNPEYGTGTIHGFRFDHWSVEFDNEPGITRHMSTRSLTLLNTLPKKDRFAKKRETHLLWTDSETGEHVWLPKDFIRAFVQAVGIGRTNMMVCADLLKKMEIPDTDTNRRRLRGVSDYLHSEGVLVVSVRSTKGGYFIAESAEERDRYAADQRKFAESMLATASLVENLDPATSMARFLQERGN